MKRMFALWRLFMLFVCLGYFQRTLGGCVTNCTCRRTMLRCTEKGFPEFPSNIDPNTRIVLLFKNNITKLPANLSLTLPSLNLLDLSDNQIERIETHAFKDLKNLGQVNLEGNRITKVGNNLFAGVESDKLIINLEKNFIRSIQEETFQGYSGEVKLNLRSNQLDSQNASLHPNSFSTLIGLKNLHLDNNRLREVHPDLFKHNTELEFINLAHNRINSLSQASFSQQGKLVTLHLQHNNISSLPDGTFDKTEALIELHLSHNKLQDLPHGIFSNTGKLDKLFLDHNNFKFPPVQALEAIVQPNLKIIMKGNRFLCNCLLKEERMKYWRVWEVLTDVDNIRCIDNPSKTVYEALSELDCRTTTPPPTTLPDTTTTTTEAVTTITEETYATMFTDSISQIGERTTTEPPPIEGKRRENLPLIITISLVGVIIIVIAVLIFYLYRKCIANKVRQSLSTTSLSGGRKRGKYNPNEEQNTPMNISMEEDYWSGSRTSILRPGPPPPGSVPV